MNRNSTRHSSVSSSLKTLFFFFLRLAIRTVKQINLNLTTPCLTLFRQRLLGLITLASAATFEFMPALATVGYLSVQRASRCRRTPDDQDSPPGAHLGHHAKKSSKTKPKLRNYRIPPHSYGCRSYKVKEVNHREELADCHVRGLYRPGPS